MEKYIIAPSILAADFANLGNEVLSVLNAGADWIHFLIKSYGLKVGVALNPATPISYLDYILHKIDMVLLMSVNPGFGGQSFIPGILNKISQVRGLINKTNPNIILQVDGGVNIDNIASIASSGANAFVAGSAIFKAPDYTAAIKNMRKQLFVV